MKPTFAQIMAQDEQKLRSRLVSKVPSWDVEGLVIPDSLAAEQCSGEAAARAKAGLLSEAISQKADCVADLTGGMGVDSWAFSSVANRVIYNEIDKSRAKAAEANFALLGADNIIVRNSDAASALVELEPVSAIYMDPGRRDGAGKKVFLVEDCQPDVLGLLPEIFEKAPLLMLKLSPMADLTMLRERFGGHLYQIHIISRGGEVKELLLILRRESRPASQEVEIIAGPLRFTPSEEENAEVAYSDAFVPGELLYEPDGGIMKSGAFKLLGERYGMRKIDRFTHLYLTERTDAPGKYFRIVETLPFNKAAFKECGSRYPEAEVSARNVPMSSEELRRRLCVGSTSDGRLHIFGVGTANKKLLIITEKIVYLGVQP